MSKSSLIHIDTKPLIEEPLWYRKGSSVNFTEECEKHFNDEFFQIVQYYFDMFFKDELITITSANDGNHSEYSLHGKDMAIDLRIKDLVDKYMGFKNPSESWKTIVKQCFTAIANYFDEYYFIVHVDDGALHVHCQYTNENIIEKYKVTKNGKHGNVRYK